MMNKTKNVSLFAFSILALVLVAGLASAASLSVSNVVAPSSLEHDAGSFQITFDLTNAGTADPAVSFTLGMSTGTATMTLPSIPMNDGTGTPQTVPIVAVINFPKHQSGSLIGKITVDDSGTGTPKEVPFAIVINNKADVGVVTSGTLSETSDGTITITNKGNVPLNLEISETTELDVTLSKESITNLAPGAESQVDVSLPDDVNLKFGDNAVRIEVEDSANSLVKTASFTVKKGFCEAGEVGNDLDIRDVSITNRGEGTDEEWWLLDTIEIEVDVKNVGSENVKDVFVVIGLFDSNGVDVVGDLDFEDKDEEEYDIGKINNGDTETAKFVFRVPADFDELGKYKLAVKAYSDDLGEDVLCTDTSRDLSSDNRYEEIDITENEDNIIAVDEESIVITPSDAICGENVLVTLEVYNVGGAGEEDQVKVTMKNSKLGVDKAFVIRKGLDEGDKALVEFSFAVPTGIEATSYPLEFQTQYDYRSSGDSYREVSEDTWLGYLKVVSCGPAEPGPSSRIAAITAKLDSDARAGEELVVRATITSLRTEAASFVIGAENYQSWAALSDVSERILDLDAGESKEVVFTFDVDADAEGRKSFDIEVELNGEIVTKRVEVDIGTASKTTPSFDLGDNAVLWIIGVINVVLIILIIIVAVRISRR